jgi:hypothetical protein
VESRETAMAKLERLVITGSEKVGSGVPRSAEVRVAVLGAILAAIRAVELNVAERTAVAAEMHRTILAMETKRAGVVIQATVADVVFPASTTALAVVETETTGEASQVKEAVVAMAEQASPALWDAVRRVLERGPA